MPCHNLYNLGAGNARSDIMAREQVDAGRDDAIRCLHARYQRGELTFRAVAVKLKLSLCDLYELFEQKGLPT